MSSFKNYDNNLKTKMYDFLMKSLFDDRYNEFQEQINEFIFAHYKQTGKAYFHFKGELYADNSKFQYPRGYKFAHSRLPFNESLKFAEIVHEKEKFQLTEVNPVRTYVSDVLNQSCETDILLFLFPDCMSTLLATPKYSPNIVDPKWGSVKEYLNKKHELAISLVAKYRTMKLLLGG